MPTLTVKALHRDGYRSRAHLGVLAPLRVRIGLAGGDDPASLTGVFLGRPTALFTGGVSVTLSMASCTIFGVFKFLGETYRGFCFANYTAFVVKMQIDTWEVWRLQATASLAYLKIGCQFLLSQALRWLLAQLELQEVQLL